MFDDVEAFCLFAGYTRSGHTLVGTLLDAHHETAIAHEVPLFGATFRARTTGELHFSTRVDLFSRLVANTVERAARGRRGIRRTIETPMPLVAGGWHGRYTKLRVIGTKRGQEAPVAFEFNPSIFAELEALVRAPLRLLHVYRNPWDNIASMARQNAGKAPARYFRRVDSIRRIKEAGLPMHDLALEDLIADPRAALEDVLGFLGLEGSDDYLDACAAIVDDKPHASREEHQWSKAEIGAVQRRMEGVPWLERYPRSPDAGAARPAA